MSSIPHWITTSSHPEQIKSPRTNQKVSFFLTFSITIGFLQHNILWVPLYTVHTVFQYIAFHVYNIHIAMQNNSMKKNVFLGTRSLHMKTNILGNVIVPCPTTLPVTTAIPGTQNANGRCPCTKINPNIMIILGVNIAISNTSLSKCDLPPFCLKH